MYKHIFIAWTHFCDVLIVSDNIIDTTTDFQTDFLVQFWASVLSSVPVQEVTICKHFRFAKLSFELQYVGSCLSKNIGFLTTCMSVCVFFFFFLVGQPFQISSFQ